MAEPITVAPWLHLSLPATVQALGPLQALVLAQAQALGFWTRRAATYARGLR